MNPQSKHLILVKHERDSKQVVIHQGNTFADNMQLILTAFKIPTDQLPELMLQSIDNNQAVYSSEDLREGEKYAIKPFSYMFDSQLSISNDNRPDEALSTAVDQELGSERIIRQESDHLHRDDEGDDSNITSLEEVRSMEGALSREAMTDKIKEWAQRLGFSVRLPGGRTLLKDGTEKLKLICSDKDCPFQLIFTKFYTDDSYTINEDSSITRHNHGMRRKVKAKWTPEIEDTLYQFMENVSLKVLKAYIQRIHNVDFTERQIESKIQYLQEKRYGKPTEDAQRLLRKLLVLQANQECYLTYECDGDNRLLRLLFISKRMKALYESFSDVLFIDSTFSPNRFNMPVADLCGVDNFGRNILFGFAIINNSTEDTYVWMMRNFQQIMERDPEVVYSDQEQAIVNSIAKIFPTSTHNLCAWHISRNLCNHYRSLNDKKKASSDDKEIFRLLANLPFEEDLYTFKASVRKIESSGIPLEYFNNVLLKKCRFAACYVK